MPHFITVGRDFKSYSNAFSASCKCDSLLIQPDTGNCSYFSFHLAAVSDGNELRRHLKAQTLVPLGLQYALILFNRVRL